jgi:hypothetical protein
MLDNRKNPMKIVCEKGGARSVALEQKMTEHTTLLLFVSAAGGWLKPLAICPLKTLPEFAASVYEDFNISGQENGWIDGAIFKNYIENYFVQEMDKMRANKGEEDEPVLLVMDHHVSRDALDAKMLWEKHKILLLLIPAHSSHIVQPLDLSTNGEFKQKFRERFEVIIGEDASTRRNRMMQIAARVLSRVNNKDTILTGWARAGLWPYNPEVAYRSTAVVDRIDQLPSSKLKKKRKRGPKINGGQIIYNGEISIASPQGTIPTNAFDEDEHI